jgi:hypothetical protein
VFCLAQLCDLAKFGHEIGYEVAKDVEGCLKFLKLLLPIGAKCKNLVLFIPNFFEFWQLKTPKITSFSHIKLLLSLLDNKTSVKKRLLPMACNKSVMRMGGGSKGEEVEKWLNPLLPLCLG